MLGDAFWASKYGDIIDLQDGNHANYIVANPEKFDLTKEYVAGVFKKHGKKDMADAILKGHKKFATEISGGDLEPIREELLLKVMDKWFRVRKYRNQWSVETQMENPVKNLRDFAQEMMTKGVWDNEPVVISFGPNFKKQAQLTFGELAECKQWKTFAQYLIETD